MTVCLSYEDQQLLYQQSGSIERYDRLNAEEVLKRQQTRIESGPGKTNIGNSDKLH